MDLTAPTADLPHRLDGLLTIDHIAVATGPEIQTNEGHVASAGDGRLSDHDAYVVTTS